MKEREDAAVPPPVFFTYILMESMMDHKQSQKKGHQYYSRRELNVRVS